MQISKFNFNGTPIRDDAEFLCLTDMWRAGGADPSKQPSNWLGSVQAREFSEFLAENATPRISGSLVRATEGRTGGTWAHWQLAMAYAKYLSPAFHAWCNEVVRAVMQGRAPQADLTPIVRRLDEMGALIVTLQNNQAALWCHISQGGYISRARLEALRGDWTRLAEVEVLAGKWATRRAAIRDIHREMGESCDWGGKGKPWNELPAALEPAARAVLNRRHKDATRARPLRQTALELIPKKTG